MVQTAQGERSHQPRLEEGEAPEWVEVDARRLRVERVRVVVSLKDADAMDRKCGVTDTTKSVAGNRLERVFVVD